MTLISTFATPISNFSAFSFKTDFYWLPDFNNIHAPLFPDCQFSLYLLFNIVTTRLQLSIILNLIAVYNKYFTIILKIHICHFPPYYCFFMHLFCFNIKIVKRFIFSFTPILYRNIITYQCFY